MTMKVSILSSIKTGTNEMIPGIRDFSRFKQLMAYLKVLRYSVEENLANSNFTLDGFKDIF